MWFGAAPHSSSRKVRTVTGASSQASGDSDSGRLGKPAGTGTNYTRPAPSGMLRQRVRILPVHKPAPAGLSPDLSPQLWIGNPAG
ncbi:hypothetical protein MTER_35290 [Mycolicibacter terrae]|uniref:Uncharacterized protein n=1 Tax=Mycolicibacter terrae TaxID=1788 RepID=A0AAD1MI41_9MYCO|nr:hypothetical protein MTER_35290 [Mycolicibacter terrae]